MAECQDAYAAVIADLKRRRDELDAMIAQLEAMASGGQAAEESPGSAERSRTSRHHTDFLGMSIVDAAKILLSKHRKPLRAGDILAGLEAGGLILERREQVQRCWICPQSAFEAGW